MQLITTSLFNDANLVSYYQGESTADSKGTNTLTNNGSTPFNPALYGNGFDFGASNTTKWMSAATNMGVSGGAISMVGWFKLTTETQDGYFFYCGSATSNVAYFIQYIYNAGAPILRCQRLRNGTVADNIDYSPGLLGTTKFYHTALTYDGSTMHHYFAGVDRGSSSISGTGATSLSNDFEIGARAGSNLLAGIMDDVAVFNRGLTAGEITTLSTNVTSGFFMGA